MLLLSLQKWKCKNNIYYTVFLHNGLRRHKIKLSITVYFVNIKIIFKSKNIKHT